MSAWILLCVMGQLLAGIAPAAPFAPDYYAADENAAWRLELPEGVDMTDEFISPPRAGQDRGAWLQALQDYRRIVREGGGNALITLNFDGVRAWTRLSLDSSRSMALRAGDRIEVQVESRWQRGNGTLCVAFDLVEPASGAWLGWSGVLATLDTPHDGAWHAGSVQVVVPDATVEGALFRPIFGLDATHDNTPGVLDIRNLSVQPADSKNAAASPQPAVFPPLDRSVYDRPDLAWARDIFTCHFTFMYDRAFYDPDKGYTVDTFLEDGRREFGGYDAVVLWQGYPRLGIDDRNQFDMYADMPGGLGGLRAVVDQFHAHGVRVFIDYNPWDVGTRRPPQSDEDMLAEYVRVIDADGIFLDTLSAASPTLRAKIDAVRQGVVIAPEIHPPVDQLGVLNLSWAQWLNDPRPPGMLHLKWIEPRHLQHQIRRWHPSHREEIEIAFFNGSGMLVWENIFGSYNPWNEEDRALWRYCVPILHAFRDNLVSDAWDPFYPTLQEGLYAHRWPGEGATLFTLRRVSGADVPDKPALELLLTSISEDMTVFDLWAKKPARIERDEQRCVLRVFASVEPLGGIAILPVGDSRLAALLALAPAPTPLQDRARDPFPQSVEIAPVAPGSREDLAGMVLIPGGPVRLQLSHQRRECGCYPNPGTPPDQWARFLTGENFHLDLSHDFTVELEPFHLDEAEVTNTQYKAFLDATGYRPANPENFLKHWPGGRMPEALADHPVVYVDLDDARAYARWAGKRLPTEAEWHLAAAGPDNLAWPWGNEFDPARVNTTGATLPARSLPEGRSPYGCYHMSGNVWEWTDPPRDDSHTRYVMIRGGSFYRAEGSGWYTPGGPQPNTAHTKFLLMAPGLDRCATIGFRCAR